MTKVFTARIPLYSGARPLRIEDWQETEVVVDLSRVAVIRPDPDGEGCHIHFGGQQMWLLENYDAVKERWYNVRTSAYKPSILRSN